MCSESQSKIVIYFINNNNDANKMPVMNFKDTTDFMSYLELSG